MAQKLIATDGVKSATFDSRVKDSWDFVEAFASGNVNEIELYSRVAAAFRAFNLKANTVSSMPFILYKKNGEEYDSSKQWENKIGFLPNPQELLRLDTLSYMTTNTVYNLRTSDILGYKTKGLYHAVATSFSPVTNPATSQLEYIERWIGAQREVYQPEDKRLVRMWRLDHTTEVLPSPNTEAKAIMSSAGVVFYADAWIQNFYRRGGIKPTLIAMKGMVNTDKKEDAEKSWSDFLRGLGKFTNRIARLFNAESMDIKPFGSGVDDMKDNNIYEQALANIAMGTGMPLSLLLSNSANYATAQVELSRWFNSDIIPLCNWLCYEYNSQVFEPIGFYLEFKPETLDPQQEDETERATAINTFMDFLVKCPTADIALESAATFGYELTDGLVAAIQSYFKDKEKKAEELAKQTQNAAVSPDGKKPEEKPVDQPADQPDTMDNEDPKPAKWLPSLDELEDMRIWREVALRRLKHAESMDFDYQPHHGGLPEAVTATIKAALAKATTAEEVKAAFVIESGEHKSELVILAESMNNLADKMALAEKKG